jgi:hypothetical protein
VAFKRDDAMLEVLERGHRLSRYGHTGQSRRLALAFLFDVAIPSKRILGMEDMELLALGFGVSAAPKLGDCAKAPSLKVEYLSGDPQFR